jgi:predicted XRE-type DNA-binding protein
VVGTKINDAHQDPNIPVELEIRRNIFKKIIHLIETKYLKETTLQFI